MALAPGSRFGSYEVIEPVGSGGMGEVWRARDTKLKREVALKALPQAFVEDADRLARFQREAEILASLNHPNIATIHGLEKVGDQIVIVMELVDGPTVADRIEHGPLPPDEAMGIALQVIAALEAAHAKQIVHRDLKPANIKLRKDGTVKVLDFGISKPIDPRVISGASPVMTTPAVTQTGVILGTAAYMSPEQARGKFVDERTDIWAFGCLLFEMLTGQPAFGGEDVMLTLARVLDRDTDLSSMPKTISPAVRQTIKLCLLKDPKQRIADIRDVRLALAGTFESELPRSEGAADAQRGSRRALPLALAMLVAGGAIVGLGAWIMQAEPPAPEVRRSIHRIPANQQLNWPNVPGIAIARDGSEIVYAGGGGLVRRPLSELEGRLIPGTERENSMVPVYSPDTRSVLYAASFGGQVKRVALEGGTPLPIAAYATGGWRWSDDDMVYLSDGCSVRRMPSDGGEPEPLFDDARYNCFEPEPLPGGRHLIFEQRPSGGNQADVAVYSFASGDKRVLFPGKQPFFVEPGYLIYFEPTLGLMARTFDPESLEYGSALPLGDDILQLSSGGGVQYRVSPNGTLVYVRGSRPDVTSGGALALLSGNGDIEFLDDTVRAYRYPALSPDGSRLAVEIGTVEQSNIFIYDLSGATEIRRLTFAGSNRHPTWTPDGAGITFASDRDGRWRIWQQPASGGDAKPLLEPAAGEEHTLPAWAPDGRLTYVSSNDSGIDTMIVDLAGGEPELLLGGDGEQIGVAFSPDGEAMAYISTVGASQIYAEPFPRDGTRVLISEAAARTRWPVWSGDSTQLFFTSFVRGFGIVDIDTGTLAISDRRGVGNVASAISGYTDRMAAGMPGRAQWLLVIPPNFGTSTEEQPSEIIVVENWIEEVKQRLPLD